MGKIIYPRHIERNYFYELFFQRNDDPGSGYGFPCDSSGKVDIDSLQISARRNYEQLLARDTNWSKGFKPPVLQKIWQSVIVPCRVRCDCDEYVDCDNAVYGSECPRCGRLYGLNGEGFRPRSEWVEPIEPMEYY